MTLHELSVRQLQFTDILSLKHNIPLFELLSQREGSFIKDPCAGYRLGVVVIELLKYIKIHRLYTFPSTLKCDSKLQVALGVQDFEITQLGSVIYSATCIGKTRSFGLYEEFIFQSIERHRILQLLIDLARHEDI